ncbi:uncharacterized protein METZ01_LOCUS277206, partial [marine metagenome]
DFADLVEGKATCNNDACLNDGTLGQQNDVDDDCYCTLNTNCYDHCEICKFEDSTTTLGTIDSTVCTAGTYPHPESCLDRIILAVVGSTIVYDTLAMMDCIGTCSNFQMDDIDYPYGAMMIDRWIDTDGDGLGGAALDAEKACSIDSGYSDNDNDINDNIYCKENILDCADTCMGSAYEDCGGVCDADSTNDDTFRLFYFDDDGDGLGGSNSIFACSADESVNIDDDTVLLNELFESNTDVSDDIYCTSNEIDECGFCDGYDLIDDQGNCVFIVFPGDVDNDGSVKLTDIDYIINYWGQDIKARKTTKDISGQKIKSTYTFSPAQYHLLSDINGKDRCLLRADTNGDGKISMQDINAVLLNLNSSHPYPDEVGFCSESSISRESNYSLYLEIYNSLPPGELKNSIAREYGFDIIPYEF